MTDIKSLKTKLVEHLIDQLEHPPEDGVPTAVLSTAAKVVKDFAHEIIPDDDGMIVRDQKLAAFLNRQGVRGSA